MKRSDLESYNADTDYPWRSYPNYQVFCHASNRKWFALIMDVPKVKAGSTWRRNNGCSQFQV